MNISFLVLSILLIATNKPIEVNDVVPPTVLQDIKGRSIKLPVASHVTIISFASKSTAERAGELTRAVRVNFPNVVLVSVIDVSSYPSLFSGMVKSKLKTRHEEAVVEARTAFQKVGKTVPDDLDARIHLVPDFEQTWCKLFGAVETDATAYFALIGRDGRLKAFYGQDAVYSLLEKALLPETP